MEFVYLACILILNLGLDGVTSSSCPIGRFGIDCAFTCHCAEEGCDPDTGQCDVGGCQTGWRGPSCYVPSSELAYHGKVNQSSVNIQGQIDASNAVDGLPGEDSCSHTYPNAWSEAWWMLDLVHRREIKTIKIIFSRKHTSIISGYFLYVSNVSLGRYDTRAPDTAHLCYHDDYSTTDPPPYRQSHQCSVTGRYVIVYNNRSSSLPNLPSPYSPEDAVVELCDVQVFDCMSSTFGPNCNRTCHCMSGGCNPNTGECYVPGCQRGWTGESCSLHECSVGCFGTNCSNECHCRTGGCNVVNGICVNRGCTDGWRGDACNTACSSSTFGPHCSGTCHCMSGTCNPKTGACSSLGCQRGWTGQTCSKHECDRGYFGANCTDECHCKTGGCNIVKGTCTTRGCTEGWRGDACNTACDSHTFGRDCNQICHCASSGCDSGNGNCIVHGCTEGWMGNTCSQECTNHKFGRDCNQTCRCANSNCDRRSGICTIPGCTEGWMGNSCSQGCLAGRFGKACLQECHCKMEGCDTVDGSCNAQGCKDGWRGKSCDHTCDLTHFGPNCIHECHCNISGCSNIDGICEIPGCEDGWTGASCSKEQEPVLIKGNWSHFEEVSNCQQYITGYAVLGTFLSISVSINIGLIIHCLRIRFRNSRTQTTSHELQTNHIPDHEDNYDSLDSSKINTTRNVYDTIVK